MKRALSLAAVAVVLLTVSPAQAASKNAPTSTIALAAGSSLHYGGTATFAVTYPKSIQKPWIRVDCYQATDASGLATYVIPNGFLVYTLALPVPPTSFVLGPSIYWQESALPWAVDGGGPAHCTATLYYNTVQPFTVSHTLASMSFDTT